MTAGGAREPVVVVVARPENATRRELENEIRWTRTETGTEIFTADKAERDCSAG
jgi:hypothetical protein